MKNNNQEINLNIKYPTKIKGEEIKNILQKLNFNSYYKNDTTIVYEKGEEQLIFHINDIEGFITHRKFHYIRNQFFMMNIIEDEEEFDEMILKEKGIRRIEI